MFDNLNNTQEKTLKIFNNLNNTKEKTFKIYTNVSFADNVQDRKSTQDYLLTLFGGPIV